MLPDSARQQIVFPPRPGAYKVLIFNATFLAVLMCGCIAALIFEHSKVMIFPLLAGIFVFGGVLRYTLRALRDSRKRWGADEFCLIELTSGQRIPWEQVADLQLTHGLGGLGELDIVVFGAQRRRLAAISSASMADFGLAMLDLLQARLPHIFENTTRRYLSGDLNWGITAIRQIMRLDRDLLYVEFPKLKKQIIPLRSIQRVEWLPGGLSGNKPGFVRIVHEAGKLELPQRIHGMQYFLYALKYFAGLGERVNPPRQSAVAQQLLITRRKSTSSSILRVSGIVLIVLSLIHIFKGLPEYIAQRNARTLGVHVTATINQRLPQNRLQIAYATKGGLHTATVGVRNDHAAAFADRTTFTVQVLPPDPRSIWFPGSVGLSDRTFMGLFAFNLACILTGIILLLIAHRRTRKFNCEIARLEAEAFSPERAHAASPTPAAPQSAEWAAPPPSEKPATLAAFPSAMDASVPPAPCAPIYPTQPTRACTQCGQPIDGPYYLDGTNPWCPTCKGEQPNLRPKLTCGGMLRAFAFGLIGALIAGGLWATTSILTGYELGIIAILVGLIVGYAVRLGARGPGSRSAQTIAIALTFYALAYAMLPVVIHQITKNPEMRAELAEAFERGLQTAGERQHPFSNDEDAFTTATTTPSTIPPVLTSSNATTSFTTTTALAALRPTISDDDERILDSLTSGTTITTRIATQFAEDIADLDYRVVATDTSGTLLVLDAHPPTSATLAMLPPSSQRAAGHFSLPEPDAASFGARHPILGLFIALILLLILFLLGPVVIYVAVIVSSPFSALFLAIALWEAWKLNRHVPRDFAGPFADQPEISFAQAEYHP